MRDSGRQKDRQRWERKEWASLVKKHPRRVKASPWGYARVRFPLSASVGFLFVCLFRGFFVVFVSFYFTGRVVPEVKKNIGTPVGYPARRLAWQGQRWDWLAQCQCTVFISFISSVP